MSSGTILVVDDSRVVRRAIALMLPPEVTCLEAGDGEEALAILQDRDVDLVLTDVNMPKMDGFAFVAAMRSLPRHAFTRVLVLTTEREADVGYDLKRVGASGMLQKPVDRRSLNSAVKRFMPRP